MQKKAYDVIGFGDPFQDLVIRLSQLPPTNVNMHMDDYCFQGGGNVSGGQKQRLAIARALVNNPSTIIADEPTGNLDPARSLEIMTLLERINALGTTVIVVTHERGLVNHFNKRVIYLDSGRVAGDATGTYEGVVSQ